MNWLFVVLYNSKTKILSNMGKVAIEQEAYNIGRKGTPTSKKCCTKERAEALGCEVSNGYKSNQLVQLTNLSKSTVTFYWIYFY